MPTYHPSSKVRSLWTSLMMSIKKLDLTSVTEWEHLSLLRFWFTLKLSVRVRRLRHLLEGSMSRRHTHCMAWVNYCSRGQVSKPPGGILENYHELEVSFDYRSRQQNRLRAAYFTRSTGVLANFGGKSGWFRMVAIC